MADEPAAMNCWAPEIFYDDQKKQYLIFWATTIPGRFPATETSGDNGLNHRIYYVTTNDFTSYSKTALLYDGGFNVIDATIVKSGAGDPQHLSTGSDSAYPLALASGAAACLCCR